MNRRKFLAGLATAPLAVPMVAEAATQVYAHTEVAHGFSVVPTEATPAMEGAWTDLYLAKETVAVRREWLRKNLPVRFHDAPPDGA